MHFGSDGATVRAQHEIEQLRPLTISLDGEFEPKHAARLQARIELLLSEGQDRIILVLDDLRLAGPVATDWLEALDARARAQGGGIVLVSAHPEHRAVARMLRSTGLLPRIFGYFTTEKEALRAFAAAGGRAGRASRRHIYGEFVDNTARA